jgi:hypothetical protein
MTSKHRTRAGVAAALALASLTAAAPAGADPNPAQRAQASERARAIAQEQYYDPSLPPRVQANKDAAALAQEQYYESHKPAIPGPGHDFDAADSTRATEAAQAREQYNGSHPSAMNTRAEAPLIAESPSSDGFEWNDAAIGAGSALAIVLVFTGGAVAIQRRQRPATP